MTSLFDSFFPKSLRPARPPLPKVNDKKLSFKIERVKELVETDIKEFQDFLEGVAEVELQSAQLMANLS